MARPYSKGTSIPYVPTDAANLYPETDGKPMAASDYHRRLLIWTLQALEKHFAQKPEVYISGDIMMYYREGGSPEVYISRCTRLFWHKPKATSDV